MSGAGPAGTADPAEITRTAAAAAWTRHEVDTPHGPAVLRLLAADRTEPSGDAGPAERPGPARGTLLVGHGAGGRRDAADVLALTALTADGWTVGLVDQPWRVAGRTVATPPPTLDRAWLAVLAATGDLLPGPLVVAGRSAGARVACRTGVQTGARAVVCLAFPLHPPGRPERSRAEELAVPVLAGLPTLVVQGRRDPMGTPEEILEAAAGWPDRPADGLELHPVTGSHSPTRDLDGVVTRVRTFLDGLVAGSPSRPADG